MILGRFYKFRKYLSLYAEVAINKKLFLNLIGLILEKRELIAIVMFVEMTSTKLKRN
jgi:hypothetical protein